MDPVCSFFGATVCGNSAQKDKKGGCTTYIRNRELNIVLEFGHESGGWFKCTHVLLGQDHSSAIQCNDSYTVWVDLNKSPSQLKHPMEATDEHINLDQVENPQLFGT
jgi:hypothetical protein